MNHRDITQWVGERLRAPGGGSEVEDWISTARQLHPVREIALVTVSEYESAMAMWEQGEQR